MVRTTRIILVACLLAGAAHAGDTPADPEFPPGYVMPDLDRMISVPAGLVSAW